MGAGGCKEEAQGACEYHAWMERNFQWDQLSVFHNSCPVICEITWSSVKGGLGDERGEVFSERAWIPHQSNGGNRV